MRIDTAKNIGVARMSGLKGNLSGLFGKGVVTSRTNTARRRMDRESVQNALADLVPCYQETKAAQESAWENLQRAKAAAWDAGRAAQRKAFRESLESSGWLTPEEVESEMFYFGMGDY